MQAASAEEYMADEILKQMLIVAFETLRENQLALAGLSNKVTAFEDSLQMVTPDLARAYVQRVKSYQQGSGPFDQDIVMQRFDDLIRKLKGV
jgi:hypothetical protein